MNFQEPKSHHYVPRSYLKNFSLDGYETHCYRTLVCNENVPLWRTRSIKAVACHQYLYTKRLTGNDSSLETLFADDYESPAAPVLQKVLRSETLADDSIEVLVRLLAAQDLRSLATALEMISSQRELTLQNGRSDIARARARLPKGVLQNLAGPPTIAGPEGDGYPLLVRSYDNHDSGERDFDFSFHPGKESYIHQVHRLLGYVDVLLQHQWTVLTAPSSNFFFTTDRPVLKVRRMEDGSFARNAGWEGESLEIMMPLSPRHLLYCCSGGPGSPHYSQMSLSKALHLRKMMAANAHRYIFSAARQKCVARLRVRRVDREADREEEAFWRNWDRDEEAALRAWLSRWA